MQCKYVRESPCISFLFHPSQTSLFSLVHFKHRLRIMQQNLYTGLIINQFSVPLQEGNLQVDNYALAYNETHDYLILTLFNRMLVYSVGSENKNLLLVTETQGKNPYYIHKMVTSGNYLYFSATQQKNIYGVHLKQSIKSGSITNYLKFKTPASTESEIVSLTTTEKVLIALCKDKVVRVWELDSQTALKGISIENIGVPTCLRFSMNNRYLLVGTSDGYVHGFDGESLGHKNIYMMKKRLTNNISIHSLSWFHYSGQEHSLRFLALTSDGNIKLYSFWFKKVEGKYHGDATELSLLYINKNQIDSNSMIHSHKYANFIFFSPGILLFMVDHCHLIYYPVIVQQPCVDFLQLVPNPKKQIFYCRDLVFMDKLVIKRVKDNIESRISLSNDLEYQDLKVLKLDMRPLNLFKKVAHKTKFMMVYHLLDSIRVFITSACDLNKESDSSMAYVEYRASSAVFIGPDHYHQPFVLIVQDDKQKIIVVSQAPPEPDDLKICSEQEKKYFKMKVGQISSSQLQIKVEKVYRTPFRDSYAVLYQSQNLLRFSCNLYSDVQLMNYNVMTAYSLRLNYTDIILDVIWTSRGEMGAVVCVDKIIFINSELKTIRYAQINGYIVQSIWIGYTLLITTKKDVQYLDILNKPQQAYCLERLDSKYLVFRVMADRVFGIENSNLSLDKSPNSDKTSQEITIKARYFNIMEPLVTGYLNYLKVRDEPVDNGIIKTIIESYAPYFIVNEEFIELLNSRNLMTVSQYFIEGNESMFSRPLRAKTLNCMYMIQRFIPDNLWLKDQRKLLDLFLTFKESQDSADPYEKEKCERAGNQLRSIVGNISFDSIKNISETKHTNALRIANSFGEKSLIQLYCDVDKSGEPVTMEIQPFKAENAQEWLGHFGVYIESHVYFADEDDDKSPAVRQPQMGKKSESHSSEGQQNQFKDLVVYYRVDDGKGATLDDLSDHHNDGYITDILQSREPAEQSVIEWNQLHDEPMEFEDKWGKKCPPQYSITKVVKNSRKLAIRTIKQGFCMQLWIKVKPYKPKHLSLFQLDNMFSITLDSSGSQVAINLITDGHIVQKQKKSECKLPIGQWVHFSAIYRSVEHQMTILYNCQIKYEAQIILGSQTNRIKPSEISIGDEGNVIEFTEFRFWRKILDVEDIKQNMRTPLEIVAEKRKRMRMKLKEKKKESVSFANSNAFTFDL